jgi:outer membrane protein assembly factor BamB
MNTRTLAALIACLAVASLPLLAADWPQWRGPDRTDISKETGLLKSWPDKGPKLLWTYSDAGTGYSGPAIIGERLYTMGADSDNDLVYALDTNTGKRVWSTKIARRITLNRGDGPRGSPTVDGDRLYAIGSQGELICVDRTKGKKLWSVNLVKDLGGAVPHWGYTESPLVDGDKVICTPGGRKGAVAALDKTSGAEIWRSKDFTESAAYSSLVAATVGGVRQYVQMTTGSVVGVAADSGRVLWRYPRAAKITVPTPIVSGDFVYTTSGYGVGCDLIKLGRDGDAFKFTEVYSNKTNKNMVNHHGGVILVGDYLYGYSESKGWVCQELKTGKLAWNEKKLGKGSVTFADGRLYCYSEGDGTVVLIEASPQGWKGHGRFTIPKKTKKRPSGSAIWTHPVVSNGRLYLRDHEFIFCYDVKAP